MLSGLFSCLRSICGGAELDHRPLHAHTHAAFISGNWQLRSLACTTLDEKYCFRREIALLFIPSRHGKALAG